MTDSEVDTSEVEGGASVRGQLRRRQQRRRLTPVRHAARYNSNSERADSESDERAFRRKRGKSNKTKQKKQRSKDKEQDQSRAPFVQCIPTAGTIVSKAKTELDQQEQQQRLEKLLLLQKQQKERLEEKVDDKENVNHVGIQQGFKHIQIAHGLYDTDTQLSRKIKRLQTQIRESRMLLGQPSSPLHQRVLISALYGHVLDAVSKPEVIRSLPNTRDVGHLEGQAVNSADANSTKDPPASGQDSHSRETLTQPKFDDMPVDLYGQNQGHMGQRKIL